MRSRQLIIVLILGFGLSAMFPGCGALRPVGTFYDNSTAYYNTYYNIKRYFAAAERQRRVDLRNQRDSAAPPPPASGYQKVIESGASLLEYYPDCRWVDDTLLLMGIAYYRIMEYGRAERKFSELQTIFPNSEHFAAASVWRARAMSAQGQFDAAEEQLTSALARLKRKDLVADAHLSLAQIYTDKEQWDDAATHFRDAAPHLKSKDERMNAWFNLGLSFYEQGDYEEARKAFHRVNSQSRNLRQAYDAGIYWSRCALNLGDFADAERILYELRRNPLFEELRGAIDVEIAALAVATGRVDEGIALYQDYIDHNESSEPKGVAYFRLGEIYRDQKLDLVSAKAKFDSVNGSGASSSLKDSARVASEGLSRGLLAFNRLTNLQDSIALAHAELDSLQSIDWTALPELPVVTDSTDSADSAAVSKDSTAEGKAPVDSSVAEEPRAPTPASMLADSLVRALQVKHDSSLAEKAMIDSLPVPAIEDTLSPAQRQVQNRIEFLDSLIVEMRSGLLTTHLQIAEFYDQTLGEPDSSLRYMRLAVEDTVRSDDYWKALLQLASRLEADGADKAEIQSLYARALAVEDLPLTVQNMVRERLGFAPIEEDVPLQQTAFERAEAEFMIDALPVDSILSLYEAVVAMDSASSLGLQALFAIEYIHEYRLQDFDRAKEITQAMIALFPDSSFVPMLNAKLTEPPSGSVFLLTDEEIAAARARAHQTVSLETDSTGWPPPEDELRGRRF